MRKIDLLNIQVNTGAYRDFLSSLVTSAQKKESQYACIANVHMLVEAYTDNRFADIISNANFITPDGKPLAWAMKLLYGIKQDRVAGMDLLPDLLRDCSVANVPVFFYGATPEMLERTKDFLMLNYPELVISGMYSPPFGVMSKEEEEHAIDMINGSGAGLVFVVLGCPKQERWMAEMKGKINALKVGIGGALPVLIGIQKRAPVWMQKYGMEWAFRLMQEPVRLFRRYAFTNSMFVFLLMKEYIRIKVLNRYPTVHS